MFSSGAMPPPPHKWHDLRQLTRSHGRPHARALASRSHVTKSGHGLKPAATSAHAGSGGLFSALGAADGRASAGGAPYGPSAASTTGLASSCGAAHSRAQVALSMSKKRWFLAQNGRKVEHLHHSLSGRCSSDAHACMFAQHSLGVSSQLRYIEVSAKRRRHRCSALASAPSGQRTLLMSTRRSFCVFMLRNKLDTRGNSPSGGRRAKRTCPSRAALRSGLSEAIALSCSRLT
mmetsp:Transcript_59897/g.137381  ORF Transcript_59897/g.137381 Transcript_59897/m.137381 type:complete len:233 (-) Transcript_59897:150-848(-)